MALPRGALGLSAVCLIITLREVCYNTKWFWTTVCWFLTTIMLQVPDEIKSYVVNV